MGEQLNITPFLCEAFATNKKIYKSIDGIYNTDRLRFYSTAKASPYYNHSVCDESSILQEYYYKKILGILLEAEKDKNLTELIIKKLIRKGWEYAYAHVINNNPVYIEKFMMNFIKKNKGLDNIDDDYLNSNVLIVILLCNMFEKEIKEGELYNFVISNYQKRLELIKNKEEMQSINNLPTEQKNELKEIEKKIKAGNIITFRPLECKANMTDDKLILIDIKKMSDIDKYLLCYEYIYDYENLSLISIVGKDYLTSKEIQELIYTYKKIIPEEQNIETIIKYLYPAIQIRYLCKEYKKAKKLFFENFNEELNIIIEEKNTEVKRLKDENYKLTNENNRLSTIISDMEKENKKLKKELEAKEDNKQELYSLREFMFSLDNEEEYVEIDEVNYERLKEYKGVIVGGHDSWQRKIKEMLPNFKFISTDALNFDVNILNNKEPVFIYTNCLNHGLYYKLINEIRKKDIPLYYLSYSINEKIILKQISNCLNK